MAKKKVTRKALLKEPDEFLTLSARATIFISKHSREFAYLGIAVAAIAVIYLGVNTYLNYVNKKGQEAYNMAYSSFMKNFGTEADEKALKESRELFRKVIDDYGLAKVAKLALPELAYIKYQEKNYDEAITLYEEFLSEAEDEGIYKSLVSIAVAACYEEKKDYTKAIDTVKPLMDSENPFFLEQAMLQLARLYRLSNQPEKSNEILKGFIEKFPTSPFLPLAKVHLN